MNRFLVLLAVVLVLSCNRAAPTVVNSNQSSNSAGRSEQPQTMNAHSSEDQAQKPANSNGGKWSQSGDPIDTAKFDAAIATAESNLKSRSSDDEAKKALAEAYFERGFALTQARQYASAIGDYRRALKYEPNHEESKKWIGQITSIYSMLKKDAPKAGEEPPPLPFKKQA